MLEQLTKPLTVYHKLSNCSECDKIRCFQPLCDNTKTGDVLCFTLCSYLGFEYYLIYRFYRIIHFSTICCCYVSFMVIKCCDVYLIIVTVEAKIFRRVFKQCTNTAKLELYKKYEKMEK